MTSYDEIYVAFISNCKTVDINLPSIDEKIYEIIHSAIRHYNNRVRASITWDDENESVNVDLNDDELLIISHYLRLSFLENQLIYYTTIFQPFSKDLGIKNYQSQVKSLEMLITLQNSKVDEVIRNTLVDYL